MSRLIPKSMEMHVIAVWGLIGLAVVVSLWIHGTAQAAPYVNPFWTNASPSQESPLEYVADLGYSQEAVIYKGACGEISVDVRTGEIFYDHFLFRTPGVLEDNVFGLRWRSMISGSSQLGNGVLPSWEVTAQYVLLIPGNPNGLGGHRVDIRRASGRIDQFQWNGTAYVAPGGVFDTLTTVAGNYRLTDKYGNLVNFDTRGMPATRVDGNGNTDTYTYNASYQITGLTDDRGKTYTFASNANGYLTSITDPSGRSWNFTYDASDNLQTIATPGTNDQPSGITTTLLMDGQGRLTGINDGRGNTNWQITYVGATRQIQTLSDGENVILYNLGIPGRTDRTDRNGNIYRYFFTGNQVTQRDMNVGGQSKYATLFRYSGVFLTNTVLPRGNRIDFTWDAMGNLLSRRHRTQDTSTNDPSDIVHSWTYNAANFMTQYTDPRSSSWDFGRDPVGNLTSVTHPTVTNPASQSAARNYTYNSKGQITRLADEESTNTDYSYFATGNSSDLLQKIEVDPTGLDLETLFTYDNPGNIATRTDPNGNSWSYTWDNLRRLTQSQAPSPLSYKVKYNYDGNGNVTKEEVENIDKDGNQVTANPWLTTTRTYTNTDDLATLTEEIDASTDRVFNFDYDSNQNRIRVTKPEGNKDKWEYNERDWVTKFIRGETDAKASEVEYAYDENGNLTTFTDGRDNDTDYTWDLFDRRTKATNALGHYAAWEFDKNANITKVQRKDSSDTELQRETYHYDQRNRHWKTEALFKDPSQTYSDAVTTYERLKTSQIKKITNPRSKLTQHTHDAAGRRTKTTDANSNEVSWTLDDNGNPTDWTIREYDGATPIDHDYEAEYDELNRREKYIEIDRTDSQNRIETKYYYDSRSNLVFLVNAEGNPTRWTFDGLSRMTKRERALTVGGTIDTFLTAQVTEWGFDSNSRLTSHKDDATNNSTWAYDALDRPTTQTYPDSSTIQWVHDANDNVTQLTDPAGNVVADTFDALNRDTSRSITLATGFLGTTSETRQYDALNRITLNRDNDYQLDYEYAVIGLDSYVYEETQAYYGQTAYSKTVTKTYDATGNRATEAYPSGANLSLTYAYDSIDQLTSISDGTNTLASYSYIGVRPKGTTYQSNATRTNYYTGFRREIESVRHLTSGQTSIVRMDYGYNKVHDRLYERFGGSGSSGDAFAYDKLRRLTTAWMGASTPSNPPGSSYVKQIDYNYDDDGNRSSVVTTLWQQNPTTTSYTKNNLYEYTSVGGTTHSWDSNGNLTDNGTLKFKYNYKNLIVETRNRSDNSLVGTNRYDASGRRAEKSVGSTVQRFVYSGLQVVSVHDGNDNWLQNFVWNDEIDGIQALEQADVLDYDTDGNTTEITRSYYHRNALGSVMEITDANQATVVSYRYDPYGKVTITRGGQTQSSDPLGQHWTYTGRFLDEDSGLYYYRARYYDPSTGRFLQRDPLNTFAPCPYEYASSNPCNRVDPLGLQDKGDQDCSDLPYDECIECCKDQWKEKKKELNAWLQGEYDIIDEWKDDMIQRLANGTLTKAELRALDARTVVTRWNSWADKPFRKQLIGDLHLLPGSSDAPQFAQDLLEGAIKEAAKKLFLKMLKLPARAPVQTAKTLGGTVGLMDWYAKQSEALLKGLSQPYDKKTRLAAIRAIATDEKRAAREEFAKKYRKAKKEHEDNLKKCKKCKKRGR